ncbi:Late embryogenesis abundant protein [Sesbania bispinosa]|nr:Late embryogenesis abundant protein [Sesbania bispinosa]
MGNPKYPYYYPEPETMCTRGLKICLAVTSFFLVIVAILILILSLTIFKPKDPYVSVHPVGLENLDLFSTNSTSVPLDMVITIVNPNYGGFKWENSTGYLKYQDTIIAKVPIETKSIPAHSMTNVSTSAGLMSGKLTSDSKFWSDIEDGGLNFTSNATLHGKVHMLKVFKLKATVYISCDISFNISSMSSDSSCISKIKK